MDANESNLPKLTSQILQALERRPMTIENLAYSFEIPTEEMQVIASNLLDVGLIDTTVSAKVNSITAPAIGAAIGSVFGGQ